MLTITQICAECKEQSLSSEAVSGELVIDFNTKTFLFVCPKCGHSNILDFGDIAAALNRRTKLPSIGGAKL